MSSKNYLELITPNSFLKFTVNPSLMLRNNANSYHWKCDPLSRSNLVKTLNMHDDSHAYFIHIKALWYESYLLSLREN